MAIKKKNVSAKKAAAERVTTSAASSNQTVLPPPLTLEKAYELLGEYIAAHPYSSITQLPPEGAGQARLIIERPWGDESLMIYLPDDVGRLRDALNAIYLPERFSAVWHKKTKRLEVIWTAHPIPKSIEDVKVRKFKFRFSSREYECEFGVSSPELLTIAAFALPIGNSRTGYRNLTSFHNFVIQEAKNKNSSSSSKTEPTAPQRGTPLSFWISGLEWDEDNILQLVDHLNFYMTYYDTRTPTILIHSPKVEADKTQPQTRFTIGRFPTILEGRSIDANLLSLWSACHSGDAARRFLYAFRLIEYASFSYLEGEARNEIRRILASPHALDDLTNVTDQVVGALIKAKLEDYNRIGELLEDTVDPSLLWREISQNIEHFSCDMVFDGGFVVKKFVDANSRETDFTPKGVAMFHQASNKIRNALSHGRDQHTSMVITPTIHNFERLQPWVSLITVAAGQVLVNKDVL